MMMKVCVSALMIVLLTAAGAYGEGKIPRARLEAAESMISAMGVADQVAQMQARMLHEMISVSPELRPFQGVIAVYIEKYGSWEVLKGEMARIYAEEFTAGELQTLDAFYRSDLGRKMLSRTAAIFEKVMVATQRNMEEHGDELEAMIIERASAIREAERKAAEEKQKM